MAHSNNGFNPMLSTKPEPSQPGIQYADVLAMVITLNREIEHRTANDEYRKALIDTHNSLCFLTKFL